MLSWLFLFSECNIEFDDPLELKEFSFADYVSAFSVNFTGRQWLFHDVEAMFESKSSLSGILIVGDPGSGKSAFVSHLICSKLSSPFIHDRIVGYHFCTHSDKSKQNGAKFVRNIANMIASKIPEYRDLIMSDGFLRRVLHKNCPHDPVGCFDQGIVTPLKRLRIKPTRPWYIVIDALDECLVGKDSNQDESVVSLLKFKMKRFPKWLKLILTSRNVTSILKNLERIEILSLRSDDPRNLKDIDDFVTRKIYTHPTIMGKIVVDLDFKDESPLDQAVNTLVNESQGNFQYIKIVLDHWSSSDKTLSRLDIPKSLASTYQIYFERNYPLREHFAPVRRIFEVLVAAYEPLTAQELYSVLRDSQTDLDFEYDFIPKLMDLSLFLWHGQANGHVRIYHLSLSEWLTSEDNKGGPFYVKKENGHKLLARYFVERAKKGKLGSTSEEIFHLATHIVEGGSEREAFLSLNSTLINRTDPDTNTTALHHSAANGNSEIATLLQNHFTVVDHADTYGRTPIFIAATTGHYDKVLTLFKRGADLNHRTRPLDAELAHHSRNPIKECKRRLCRYSLLHAASTEGHLRIVQFLINKSVNLHEVTGAGNTAFQLAAENDHLEVLKELRKHGVKADFLSLHHSAVNGHLNIVTYLLILGVKDTCIQESMTNMRSCHKKKKQEPVLSSSSGRKEMESNLIDDRHIKLRETALHAAVLKGQTAIIKVLTSEKENAIECFDAAGRLPSHIAVYQDNHKALETLLAAGSSALVGCKAVDFSMQRSEIHLESSCPCGYTPLHIASQHGHYSMAKLLIEHGADSNAGDCNGSTPLHIVACHDIPSFVPLLLEAGANINARAMNGSTPLHSAAVCLSTRTLKILLEAGIDPTLMDDSGMTALHYTVKDVTVTNDTYFADLYVNNPIDWIESRLHKSTHDDAMRSHLWLQSFIHLVGNLAVSKRPAFILFVKENNNATVFDILDKHGLSNASIVLIGSKRTIGTGLGISPTPMNYAIDMFIGSILKRRYVTLNKPYEQSLIPRTIMKTLSWSLRPFLPTVSCNSLINEIRLNLIYTTNVLLQAGADVNCQESGLSPLLVYLRIGGRHMAKVLAKHNVVVDIKCGLAIENSIFHLSAYHKLHYLHYLSVFYPDVEKWEMYLKSSDDALFDYLLYKYEEVQIDGTKKTVRTGDGPLAQAIKSHSYGYSIIDECVDANGYTALHRAAQGANVLAIDQFLSWGANASLETPDGLSPLFISVVYAIKFRPSLNFERPSVLTALEVEFASKSASSLLSHIVLNGTVEIRCNEANLTLFHLAATRGMSKFIEHLFVEEKVVGLNANCSNAHGVTPMYLAMMLGGNTCTWGSPWCGVVHVIKSHGGVLQYPNIEAEYFLIFNTLFGSFPSGFKVDLTEDEIQTLREECGRDECSDYNKRDAADYLNLSDELEEIFKEYKNALGYRCGCSCSLECRQEFDRLEAIVPVLMDVSSNFMNLHVPFYNVRKRFIIFLDKVTEELARHFREITRPRSDGSSCVTPEPAAPQPDIIDVCSSNGREHVRELKSVLKDRHHGYKYSTDLLLKFSGSASSFFHHEGRTLGHSADVTHALYKHETHLKCDWQRITIKYVRLRFLLHISNFWRQAVHAASITPIVSEFLSHRMEKILLNPSKESTDFILQLALGKQFDEYSYLERLKFVKPPLWRNTFPDNEFNFNFS